jgi:hypothetical protein
MVLVASAFNAVEELWFCALAYPPYGLRWKSNKAAGIPLQSRQIIALSDSDVKPETL